MNKYVVLTLSASMLMMSVACNSKAEENNSENISETEIFPEESISIEIQTAEPVDAEIAQDSKTYLGNENGVTKLTYIDGILIANKTYALPSDFDPGVDSEALTAFEEMQKVAYVEGYNIYISSGYRSYQRQVEIYDRYVSQDGQEYADTYSSRPGHSEHQTGLTFDLNSIDISFADTPEGKWLADNCHKYGFIIRYPEGKEDITGYMYEPWHIRYIGVDKATAVYESGLCLEEYLGITSNYDDAEDMKKKVIE